jgi:hypothetical protein
MRHEAELENRFSKLGGLFVTPARGANSRTKR